MEEIEQKVIEHDIEIENIKEDQGEMKSSIKEMVKNSESYYLTVFAAMVGILVNIVTDLIKG